MLELPKAPIEPWAVFATVPDAKKLGGDPEDPALYSRDLQVSGLVNTAQNNVHQTTKVVCHTALQAG